MSMYPFGVDCFCPFTDDLRPLFISKETEDQLFEEGGWLSGSVTQHKDNLFCTPCTVFRGLKREHHDDDLCYCTRIIIGDDEKILMGFVKQPGPADLFGPLLMWAELRDPESPGSCKPLNWGEDFTESCYERQNNN